MSVGLPDCKVYVGEQYNRDHYSSDYQIGIQIPNEDMIKLRAHIAMMEETSSFELTLYNFDKQYIETYPIANKDFVRIFIGRGTVLPQVFQGKVEEIDAESEAMYHELTLKGRCIGEDLYRRLVTEWWQNIKGEVAVRALLDKYCTFLRHQRNGVELIEDTDTTYTELDYDKTKLKDVLDFIAKTADKAGVIGYDYRVEYDGLFAFFARGTKTSPISLTDVIKYSNYRKTVHRVRNRIYVYGAAEKMLPATDIWSESLVGWESNAPMGLETGIVGNYCVSVGGNFSTVYLRRNVSLTLLSNSDYQELHYWMNIQNFPLHTKSRKVKLYAPDEGNRFEYIDNDTTLGTWYEKRIPLGPKSKDWVEIGSPDWGDITTLHFEITQENSVGGFWLDDPYFGKARWSAIAEAITDPRDIREMTETDEELHSDAECAIRAEALLDWLKDEAELLTLQTEILDFGNNHIQPGDMQPVVLPNENVNKSLRVLSVDYLLGEEQELPIAIELGKETPLLADYLYRLRKDTSIMARLKKGVF